MKLALIIVALFSFVLFNPVSTEAHPGRTDSSGGHTCRTNCESWGLSTGEYHSHNGGSAPAQPVQQYVAPVVQATAMPTRIPTLRPTRIPTPTKTPYVETAMDKQKMFKVTRVIDGDTIDVSIRGKVERVRLLAIDTPETVDPRKPVQCFGKEASNKLKSIVNGKFVKLVDDKSQGNRDKYQRLLRYVYDGKVFVNAEMVKQGYAFSYKQYPTKYLEEFNKLEKEAREKNLGLWNACK